ncbi:GNAT family N-acetyltransferase [Cellulomonas fimi]|uniref:GNAT family N-acetyltransferase n=1 Tax=Cellulomonas fimi TaxID=1708 RepID=A0A7Y0QI75_CELFI|nr:GNAT family N-acetyltransferase [Cellulomonas fimi]NMR20898.1 GNAT family N-acetyltransferase [Cellulomonas fimi]
MRPGFQVRAAAPADLEGLVSLCLEARAESTVGPQICSADRDRLRDQLGTLLATPGGQALVGLVDGELLGLLLGRVVGPGLFTLDVSFHVEALYVGSRARRRGLGHALLARALAVAEEAGATQVYAVPLPGARGVQRFFARLGFAPAAAHRVVTTHALQRRLAGDAVGAVPGRRGSRGLEEIIARRRQVRSVSRAAVVDQRAPREHSTVVEKRDDVRSSSATADAESQSPARASISMQVRRAVATRRDAESSSTTS